MSDKITPAKLRKDGWKKDDADETTYWIDLDIRAVYGMSDLRRLVAALRGDK